MKIQTWMMTILLSIAWSVISSSPEVEPTITENLRKAAINNILNTFKRRDSRKMPAYFDSLKLETRAARFKKLYQLQKNEADLIQANVLKLQKDKDTKSVKKHAWRFPMSNDLIVHNVDTQNVQLQAIEDVESIVDENLFPLEVNNAPELTLDIPRKSCKFETNQTKSARSEGDLVTRRSIPCVCILELGPGYGKNVVHRWYFNVGRNRCEGFYYNGYGGNDNRFTSLKECLDTCESR